MDAKKEVASKQYPPGVKLDLDDVNVAAAMAMRAHQGQKYGGRDYFLHLHAVVETLVRFGYSDPIWQICGWLHDALEDTDLDPKEISDELHPEVLKYVLAVSSHCQYNLARERSKYAEIGEVWAPAPTRMVRNEAIKRQILAFPNALPVKLADRICNVKACWESRDPRLFMYHREYKKFREAFRKLSPPYCGVVGGLEMMWRELDALHGFSVDSTRSQD